MMSRAGISIASENLASGLEMMRKELARQIEHFGVDNTENVYVLRRYRPYQSTIIGHAQTEKHIHNMAINKFFDDALDAGLTPRSRTEKYRAWRADPDGMRLAVNIDGIGEDIPAITGKLTYNEFVQEAHNRAEAKYPITRMAGVPVVLNVIPEIMLSHGEAPTAGVRPVDRTEGQEPVDRIDLEQESMKEPLGASITEVPVEQSEQLDENLTQEQAESILRDCQAFGNAENVQWLASAINPDSAITIDEMEKLLQNQGVIYTDTKHVRQIKINDTQSAQYTDYFVQAIGYILNFKGLLANPIDDEAIGALDVAVVAAPPEVPVAVVSTQTTLAIAEGYHAPTVELAAALGGVAAALNIGDITGGVDNVVAFGRQIAVEPEGKSQLLLPIEFFEGQLKKHQGEFGDRFDLSGVSGLTDSPKAYIDNLLSKVKPGEEGRAIALVPENLPEAQIDLIKQRTGIRVIPINMDVIRTIGSLSGMDKRMFQVNTYAMMYDLRHLKETDDPSSLIYRISRDYYAVNHIDLKGVALQTYLVEGIMKGNIDIMMAVCLRPTRPADAKKEYDELSYPMIFA
jgi:hypothetical protein